MSSFVTEFKNLEIQLEDIILATDNFDESKVVGGGGFGKVYAGELCHSESGEKSLVAIKRLDRKYGQGDPEFFKEIRMLSCYRHENLISLLGFCCQGGEMILVYEYASCGSLDHLLSSATLNWTQRLRICLDAAKGISFLHDPNGTQQRVLHCDIKSANILLDKNMTAKVADFGLSKMGPANQQYSLLITSAVGTLGYCDPLYMQTYSLTKESDVYSFGVVLFEVMCSRLCAKYINGSLNVYVPLWRKRYEENKLDDIILQDLRQEMDLSSLKTFSDIAYQCLQNAREERPTMSRVVEELEIALESQEFPDLRLEVLTKWEALIMVVDPLLMYKTGKQLKELLSKGLVVNEGKTLLCLNEKGQHIERICIQACLNPDEAGNVKQWDECVDSRFPGGQCYKYTNEFNARVRGEYLTPQILYTLNLVFRYEDQSFVNVHDPLRYKVDGDEEETKVFVIYPSTHMREDGWFTVPLYHFTCQHSTADIQFEFDFYSVNLLVVGFEFQPSQEKVKTPVFKEYQHIVEAASQSLFFTSLDELKQILSVGLHLNGYKTWFSLNEKGEHCHMISTKDCLIPNEDSNPPPEYRSICFSRFPAGIYQTDIKGFKIHVKTQLLSPSITYTINLVLMVPYAEQAYIDLKYRLRGETTTSIVYHATRRDHIMYKAELYQFTSDGSIFDLEITFDNHTSRLLQVEGIMFQPLEIVEDQVSKDDKVKNIQMISDSESDTHWEQKSPDDYAEILNLSKDSLHWTTKKELYSILRRGFLIDNGQQWFTVDQNGENCLMLSARATLKMIFSKDSTRVSPHESRFGLVVVITAGHMFEIKQDIKSEVLSPETKYACYLVYKLPQDKSTFEAPIEVWEQDYSHLSKYFYLVSPPHTPFIGSKLDENSYNPLNRYKGIAIPQQRSDGWIEVRAFVFKATTENNPIHLLFKHLRKKNLKGLMVQGIEIRPI